MFGEAGVSFGVSRPFVADRNICHFLWYSGVAGEGLRSVGADGELPTRSVCSILPIAHHLRAGVPRGSGRYKCSYRGPRRCVPHHLWRGPSLLRPPWLRPALRRTEPVVVRPCLPPVRGHNAMETIASHRVLGALASLIRSELSRRYWAPTLRFAPVLSCRVFLMYTSSALIST